MDLLHPDERVHHTNHLAPVVVTVVRQVPPDSPEARDFWWASYRNEPTYEIEWPDGKKELAAHSWLTRTWSFGPTPTPEQEREQP